MAQIDPILLELAELRLRQAGFNKVAFIPGGDPSGGAGGPPPGAGGPPVDPSIMGGAPGAGGPPPDPSMGAGGPPPDPSTGAGGPPPGGDPSGGAGGPDLMSALMPAIQQAVQQAVQQAMGGQGTPGAGPTALGPGKGAKIDPGMIYMVLGRIMKMQTYMFQQLGWSIPPDFLNDDATAQSVMGQPPTSLMGPQGGGAATSGDPSGGAPPSLPGIGGSGPLSPVQPMSPPGGDIKQASIKDIMSQRNTLSGMLQNLDLVSRITRQ